MNRCCRACGEGELPEHSRHCLACGAPLSDGGVPSPYTPPHLQRDIPTSRTTREGERKEVTVLFADLAGSLAIAERLDPEDIHELMDGFFELAVEAIHANGGTVNQFRGDGFMAMFGAPAAKGDDACRALRAALAIRDGAERYREVVAERYGVPLVLRMGAHTGTVWVGAIGNRLRSDYTAEGPTVGLAARLERGAQPGQILVSSETARRATRLFQLADLGERRFRGVSQSVRVFELVGSGPYEARFDAERAAGLTPFIGRELERAWLADSGPRTSEPHLAVTEIRGPVGIGKSRLIEEHLARLDDGSRALYTRCREQEATRAYSPWLDLLRRWPEALPGRADALALARDYGGDTTGVSGTLDAFADQVRELLASVARKHPLTVVIEDVHWLDPSSAEVLRSLASLPPEGAVALLTTARSELGSPWSRDTRIRTLDLGPLDARESEDLARGILKRLDDPASLVSLAAERGAGNPLFIEEVARALLEGDADRRRAAYLEIELRRAGPVPETLNGVIAARLDALPDPAKRLLQAAAVIAGPFSPELLLEIETEAGEESAGQLEELERRGLLERHPDQTIELRHVLMRDVAYDQILLARRSALHRRCALALQARGLARRPDGASRIGGHFDLAGDGAEAADHLTAAGKAYLRIQAPSEAAAHLQRAWELIRSEDDSDPSTRASVGLALASALNALDRADVAGRVLEALEREPLDATDRKRLARACIEGGWVRYSEGRDLEGGRRLIERGLALGAELPNARRLEMIAHGYLTRLYRGDGDLRRAVSSADLTLERARGEGDPLYESLALASRGSALCLSGEVRQGLASCLEAAAVSDRSENGVAQALAYCLLAQAFVYAGEPKKALDAAERARSAGTRTRQLGSVYLAATWSGEARILMDEPEAALCDFEKLVTINSRWLSALLSRARGRIALGRFDDAVEDAQDCLALRPPRVIRARALGTLGLALGLSSSTDRERPSSLILESMHLCEGLGLRPHLAEAQQALAAVHRQHGEVASARSYAEQAARTFEACGMLLHAQRARALAPGGDAWRCAPESSAV